MEKEAKKQRGFYVEKGSFFVHAAVILLALAMAARLLGTMALWSDAFKFATMIALPVISALLYILFILLLGRIALWSTILPVLGGAGFFILSATSGTDQLRMIICIVLAFVAAFVYTATLAGMIRTKWLNVIVFTLILAYQIIFLAIPAFSDQKDPISFADGMTLLSSICIILAMVFASLAIRRRKVPKEAAELPKIKDPVVIKPEPEKEEIPQETPIEIAEESHETQSEQAVSLDSASVAEETQQVPAETEKTEETQQ